MIEQAPNFPKITELAVPFFILTMLIEVIVGKWRSNAKYETRDTLVSLGMGFFSVLSGILTAGMSVAFLYFFYQFRLFDMGYSWIAILACFVLDDLRYYWSHRFGHRIRWVWASHVNHHSSQHYNLSTALRQTWSGFFTGMIVLKAPLVLIGFDPVVILFVSGINLVYQYWIHTETIGKMPNWFEAIMNTPSHHRVHHATNPKYLDANYAGVFIIWDKLFGTFVPEDASEPCRYGIVKNLQTFNILIVSFHEWIGIFKDVFKSGLNIQERLSYAFMPPGWSHDGSRQTSDMIKEAHVRRNPELVGQPGLPKKLPQVQAAE